MTLPLSISPPTPRPKTTKRTTLILSKEKFYATSSSFQKFTTTTDIVNCWNASLLSEHVDLMDFGSLYGSSPFVAYPYKIASQYWDEHGANSITLSGNPQLQFQSTRYQIWD